MRLGTLADTSIVTSIPVVRHHDPRPCADWMRRAALLAPRLAEQSALRQDSRFGALRARELGDDATLHLDDLGEIPLLDLAYDTTFLQDRARLRAGDGDFVASCATPSDDFELYCSRRLGLGAVTRLHPRRSDRRGRPLGVATACWTDVPVRHALVRAVASGRLRYIHPHIGSFSVWALADLLRRAARRPVEVIAPPPGLSRCVNDKIWFTQVVAELFGRELVPRTEHAHNYATLARLVRALASSARSLVIKVPDSAGGRGNVVLEARRFRGRTLGAVRAELKRRLRDLPWPPERRLLVGAWEDDVLSSPSTQAWIPPESAGPPIVEGLFEQQITGATAAFVGCRPARFGEDLTRELVDRTAVLARLFQQLGYVGRCSFDLVLIGSDLDSCRPEFIECNGRWGGTSLPMTLMNRLFGRWWKRPYAGHKCSVPGLHRIRFGELLRGLSDDLYDARTDRGRFIVYNPGEMQAHATITAIALGSDWNDAERRVQHELPARLAQIVGTESGTFFS